MTRQTTQSRTLSASSLITRTLASVTLAAGIISPAFAADEVNIYSYRQPFLIQPMLDQFTKETGIKTNIVFAQDGVAERLKREGKNSPADLVLTVDIARLQELVDAGLTQPVDSKVLEKNIPAQYRGNNDEWFGLTLRTRNIYASKDRVENTDLSYEDLAKPEWKNKICARSGKHQYNIALIASMIAHHGEAETEKWLKGVKENLAQKPQGGDRDQIRAVAEGTCDLAIGNSYYYGAMVADPEQRGFAEKVNVIFPNQDGRGAHVNVSGVVLTKSAPNKAEAVKLMEFLSGQEAQEMYANMNVEFPVNTSVEGSGLLEEWSGFKADKLPLDEISKHREAAVKLVDKVDFDS
ncbi:MAG: iron ABC transporter substrate-binding protein [unclassified Hahellaceae]|nr:iron ABC transporter substrate-binding protein [Hahellaceae bacterium]|tara:strand:+ start:78698 stop:79750 length:1053 start_codon:yes stop_codon:yes gene_type:complete